MKKLLSIVVALCATILSTTNLHAQLNMGANLGPFDVYVSEQGGNPVPLRAGNYTATADEGRVVNVGIFNVVGPIIIDPMNFALNGPPCPTYDIHGRRTPANPVPPNSQDFAGTIKIDPDNVPFAGTTTQAEFSARDNGFWTRCATGVQVPEPAVRTVKFNIISIEITMVDANINLCKDDAKNIRVNELYPANGGVVEFFSQNGKFDVSNVTNAGCTLKGNADGADVLIAKYTIGGVSYKTRVPVRVNFVKFANNNRQIYAWYPGGNEDATLLLDPNTPAANVTWELKLNGGNGTATINANTGAITHPNAPGGTYTLTAKSTNDVNCKATKTVIFMGYDVLVQNSKNASTCDGTLDIQVKVVPIPNTLPVAELAKYGGITIVDQTVNVDNGNEAGSAALTIGALDANFKTTIQKAVWYKTAAAGCNYTSAHWIKGQAVVNGVNVNTPLPGRVDAKLNTGLSCINGKAEVIKAFKGGPQLAWGPSPLIPGAVRCVVWGWGNFARDVKGRASWWGPAQSQFMPFVIAEENFHKNNQIENPNHIMMADLYDPNRVMWGASFLWWDGPNVGVSSAMVMQGFVALCNAEFMRSNSFFAYPSPRRCFIEAEAKRNTGIQFGFNFPCAYPLCP